MDNGFEIGLCMEMSKTAGVFSNLSRGLSRISSGVGVGFKRGAESANRAAVSAARKAGSEGASEAVAGLASRGYQGARRAKNYGKYAFKGLDQGAKSAVRKAGAGALGVGAFGAGLAL